MLNFQVCDFSTFKLDIYFIELQVFITATEANTVAP